MSFAVDVNLLLYASHTASPKHSRAREFLVERTAAPELFCVAWITAMSYLRIVTDSRIGEAPLLPSTALGNLRELLERPNVRTLSEKEGFLEIYERVVGSQAIAGKLVPDAHLAAILWQHGVKTLYTHDRDFRRFDFLDVRDPYER